MAQTGDFRPRYLLLGCVLAIVAFFAAGALPFASDVAKFPAQIAAAVTVLVTTYWLSSALPLGAASLLPLAILPIFGALPVDKAAATYAHPILWMFFGGFVIAMGIERWGLHRRIAFWIVLHVGSSPKLLVLGFMLATGFLSLWLNNTATALLVYPVGIALVESLQSTGTMSEQDQKNFAFSLLLSIAYAASIGGMGTPVGTAPNALFLSNYAPFVQHGAPSVTFLNWMAVGLPLVCIMLPVTWLVLLRLAPLPTVAAEAKESIRRQALALPPLDHAERRMAGLFLLAGILWTTRADIDLGDWGAIPGWWHLLPVKDAESIGDGTVAIFIACLAFVIPSGRIPGEPLMNWETAKHMPWDILYMLGGGMCIATAMGTTGLAASIATALKPWMHNFSPWAMVALLAASITFLSEVASNTAIAALFLPIVVSMAAAREIDPRLLMFPTTLAASCGFMLPIATPPNSIVFASGRIPVQKMARAGFLVNLLGIALITILTWVLAVPVLGIHIQNYPTWASAALNAKK